MSNPKAISWLICVGPGDSIEMMREACVATGEPCWLTQCLQSVANTHHPGPHEIVLVLDAYNGIVDPPPEPEITKVIGLAENVGVAKALNIGLEACQYDNIARLDADDMNLPERLQHQFPMLQEYDVVGGGMIVDQGRGCRREELPLRAIYETLHAGRPMNYHPTMILKRKVLNDLGGWPECYPFAEDFGLSCAMYRAGTRVGNVPQPVIVKRQHGNRASVVHSEEQKASVLRAKKDFNL